MDRTKIAIVGLGRRGYGAYLPSVRALSAELELVAVCDSDRGKAEKASAETGARSFTAIADMLETAKPEVVALVVPASENCKLGNIVAQHGISYMVETPIAPQLDEADSMIRTAEQHNIQLEVAENYYRVPTERIKRALIAAGIFGKVLTAYNDFRGHGYHGVGLIRSYVGFDNQAKLAFGFEQQFRVQEHTFRAGEPVRSDERWRHGVFEFEDGARGIFNFTSLSYGSPLRWYNSTKFYAERGMAVGDEMAILNDDATQKRLINVERRTAMISGCEVLQALVADTKPEVVWENPLRNHPLSDGQISVASELMSIVTAAREGKPPEYGALNGRKDRELDIAMSMSAAQGGAPIELPLSGRE